MSRKNLSREKIIQSFLTASFEKSAGATSLADIADALEIKKASLYNHFESKEQMYDETLAYCKTEIENVSFLADKVFDSIKNSKISVLNLFKKLISRYFELFELEPAFQVYVFVHTEQYYNLKAYEIINNQYEQLTEEIRKILTACMTEEKLADRSEKETKDMAAYISSMILHQLVLCIANRKEIVRQNPESGAGSLFELPSDSLAVTRTLKLIESYFKAVSA